MLILARLAVRFVSPARLFAWADRPPRRIRRFAADEAGWVAWAVESLAGKALDQRAVPAAGAGRACDAAPARHRQPPLSRRRPPGRRARRPCLGRGRRGHDHRSSARPRRSRNLPTSARRQVGRRHERDRRIAAFRWRARWSGATLERAANALRQHGPDRSDVFTGGGIGLAHVLMRMTPEDRFDRQPWRGQSGALIVADLRLDNRDDVLARLGVAPRGRARRGRIRACCSPPGKNSATRSGRCCAGPSPPRSGAHAAVS